LLILVVILILIVVFLLRVFGVFPPCVVFDTGLASKERTRAKEDSWFSCFGFQSQPGSDN
jgi:hypothetical protein